MQRAKMFFSVGVVFSFCFILTGANRVEIQSGHRASIWDLAFDESGKHLISASHDKTLKVWNLQSKILVRTLRFHGNSVAKVNRLRNGLFVSAAADSSIRVWRFSDGKPLLKMSGSKKHVNQLDSSADGRYILSGGGGSYIHLWNGQTGKLIKRIRAASGELEGDGCLTPCLALFMKAFTKNVPTVTTGA